ncbi:MAG: hypothetical protein L0154_26360 [Chloroflexi bacterium]|nr:hypothetical protein [Chloroflexota bacterium]
MTAQYVLGSDIGSGSCKTLLVNETGTVVARSSHAYAPHYPQPGWVEYDPQDWYTAFCANARAALSEAAIDPASIRAVCITGITHNPVLLDKTNTVLRPSIHFNDQRSLPQCNALKERWGDEVLRRATNDIGPLWTYPQLAWIKDNEPDVWSRLATLLFPKDYVRHRLTGNPPAVTDPIEASGTLLFDPTALEWIVPFLEDLGLKPDVLPTIQDPFAIVGEVSAQGARDTGLAAGTPVLTGTTDTAAENLAAGVIAPGQGTLKLASVGRIVFIAEHPARHPHLLNYPYFENLWYPGTASQFAASAYRWLHESLWADVPANSYVAMDMAAEQVQVGSDGLLFLPHLMGQFAPYWNPKLKGAFVGVGLQHDLRHFTRAVLEGVAFGIRDAFKQANRLGFDAAELYLIGNGARSLLWRQIMTDVMGRPIRVPRECDAAYGAALMAGMSAGLFPQQLGGVAKLIQIEETCTPDAHHQQLYDELFSIYRDACHMMESISEQLHRFTSE